MTLTKEEFIRRALDPAQRRTRQRKRERERNKEYYGYIGERLLRDKRGRKKG